MSYREGFIDFLVVDLWLLNACFGNGLLHRYHWYFFSITIAQSTCCQLKSMLSKSTSEWPQSGPNSTSSSKSIASTYVSAIYSHTTPHLIEKHKNNEDLNHMVQRQHLEKLSTMFSYLQILTKVTIQQVICLLLD